jgi:signal transduction histidine kinase
MRASLFSSIAHELRTPLNSIIPIIRIILESLPFSDSQRLINYLRIVMNSSLHL